MNILTGDPLERLMVRVFLIEEESEGEPERQKFAQDLLERIGNGEDLEFELGETKN